MIEFKCMGCEITPVPEALDYCDGCINSMALSYIMEEEQRIIEYFREAGSEDEKLQNLSDFYDSCFPENLRRCRR